jgi:oligosaccharide repeat unit polymerase
MRQGSLLSPSLAFPVLWLLGVALAQIHLLDVQSDWSALAWAVMLAVPIAFVCGGSLGRELVERRTRQRQRREPVQSSRRLRIVLVACLVLGYLEIAHQSAAGSGLPILSASVDDARFSWPGGPTVLLTDLCTLAAIVALSVPRRLTAPESRFELGVAGIALFASVLAANRSTLAFAAVAIFIARSHFWGLPRPRVFALGGLALALALSLIFYYRTSQTVGTHFYGEFFGEVLPGMPAITRPLAPLHIGLVTNFEALARIVDFFPDGAPYGHGAYNSQGFDLFLSDAKGLGDVSQQLTGEWVTSTVAGTFWADGGFPLAVMGVALTGLISTGSYVYARRRRSLAGAMIAGVLYFTALFGIYTNLWTTHLDWLLLIVLLIPMGELARDPTWPSKPVRRLRLRLRTAARGYAARMSEAGSSGNGGTERKRSRVAVIADRVRGLLQLPPVRWALAGLGVLLVAAFAIELTRPKGDTSGGVPVQKSLPFPADARPPEASSFATDGDFEVDNPPLWTLEPGADGIDVRAYAFSDERLAPSNPTVAPAPEGEPERPDVGSWDGAPALFTAGQGPDGLEVTVLSVLPPGSQDPTVSPTELTLVPSPRVLASGTAPVLPPSAGVTRDTAVATWSGAQADLFVIDWGVESDRPLVRIYSGESRFRTPIEELRLPALELDPEEWSLDVARVEGELPDLAMVLRSGASGHPELHALSGENDFQNFVVQRPLALPDGLPGAIRVVVGASGGVPTLYASDLGEAEPALDLVQLEAGTLP